MVTRENHCEGDGDDDDDVDAIMINVIVAIRKHSMPAMIATIDDVTFTNVAAMIDGMLFA